MNGRAVLISGASGGLGGAVTRLFLDRGARVAGTARDWRGAAATDRFLPIEADLGGEDGCRRAVDLTLERFGRIDALVHLMGGFAGGEPVERTSPDTWSKMLHLNLTAAFLLCRAVLPVMRAQGGGRIVAVGSRAGEEPSAGLSAYNVSKAGLHALIRTIAAEVRGAGITANAALPSVIDTPANRAAMPQADPAKWVAPERIAELIAFLASEEAGDINGALIAIYGCG
jgi:NAD(P)-dependent dehydrogenase (short-subunit alcohol dehydrogenase family)